MVPLVRIETHDDREYFAEGYFITTDQLVRLVKDIQADSRDGLVDNQRDYIRRWLRKEASPYKTPSHCYALRCIDQRCLKDLSCNFDSRIYAKQ